MEPIFEKCADVTVATAPGPQLDASNAEDFKRAIAPIIEQDYRLVLDLSRVTFVDSSGCGAILSILKRLNQAGGDLKICGINKPVRAVFDLIRLHKICDLFDTREDAIKAFGV